MMTGLSGNEIFCLGLKGFSPGELVVGNSVHSLGFLGGLGAGLRGIVGGEVEQVTEIIREGRLQSHARIMQEAKDFGAHGVTGVTSELRRMQGNVEFLSVGSCIHAADAPPARAFSSSSNGQELFSLIDAGYAPKQFVIGNVAYSVGVASGLFGALKSLGRGEIKEFSDVFNATRHLALRRICAEARAAGANAVVGIETRIMPFRGVHEMLMLGTAAYHPALGPAPQGSAVPGHGAADIVTSDLTCEEMWNLASLGLMPLKLVLGTAVYSLGFVGGVMAMFKGMARGEISELTSLIYDAREHAIGLIRDEANAIGADDVVGITTHVHELGGLIEFMAIGTAVKRRGGATPTTASLPVQAIIRDKDTWISGDDLFAAAVKQGGGGGGGD
jgi:uncharacterized protein YbjQ (UPF0145 family)